MIDKNWKFFVVLAYALNFLSDIAVHNCYEWRHSHFLLGGSLRTSSGAADGVSVYGVGCV